MGPRRRRRRAGRPRPGKRSADFAEKAIGSSAPRPPGAGVGRSRHAGRSRCGGRRGSGRSSGDASREGGDGDPPVWRGAAASTAMTIAGADRRLLGTRGSRRFPRSGVGAVGPGLRPRRPRGPSPGWVAIAGPVGDGSGWSSRSAVRTGRLRRSPAVHSRPIDLVVFQEPSSQSEITGNLVSEGASRLDAFSAYPVPTWLPGDAPSGTAGTPEVGPPQSSRTRGDAPQVSYAHGR